MPEKIACSTCYFKEEINNTECICTMHNLKKLLHDYCKNWTDDDPIVCEIDDEEWILEE